jgi:hypothetical protein
MNKENAQIVLMALEGLQANIDTLRNLVLSMITEPKIASLGPCAHNETREIQTHGSTTTWCDACGSQVMGVLGVPENN